MNTKQVLDIQQMQHLKELGVDTSKAMMCYRRRTRDWKGESKVGRWSLVINQPIIVSNFETYEDIPAFTLQDILDLLPATVDDNYRLYIDKGLALWTVGYVDAVSEEIYEDFRERDLIDAAYEMLRWVLTNKYIQ